MKIKVKLHLNSRQEKIIKLSEDFYEVWIKEKPIDNKANFYLEKYLKNYFGGGVKVVKGLTNKNKVVEVINAQGKEF